MIETVLSLSGLAAVFIWVVSKRGTYEAMNPEDALVHNAKVWMVSLFGAICIIQILSLFVDMDMVKIVFYSIFYYMAVLCGSYIMVQLQDTEIHS